MPSIKNILIFGSIAVVFVLAYVFFIKKPSTDGALVSSSAAVPISDSSSLAQSDSVDTLNHNSLVTKDFLTLLLSVKNIKLDDSIFSGVAFTNLRDSSIMLTPDGTEGRPNPFAALGNDSVSAPAPAPLPTPVTAPTSTSKSQKGTTN